MLALSLLIAGSAATLSAQTVNDYAVLNANLFEFRSSTSKKTFTFNSPANFVKGTNLARPILTLDMSNKSINRSAQVDVYLNGKKVTRLTWGAIPQARTETVILNGGDFRVGGSNTIEIRNVSGTSQLFAAVLYYQVKM